MRRVAVTGFGIVSPLGSTLPDVWQHILDAKSEFGPITRYKQNGGRDHVVAEVRNFDPSAHFQNRELELMDRFAQFAVAAAREALRDSGLTLDDKLSHRTGVAIGSAYGGQESYDTSSRLLYGEHAPRLHPLTIPRIMNNAAASHISIALGAKGPSVSISTACSSASHAIGEAFRSVKYGTADVMFTGGADAPITYGVMKCWEAVRVLASPGDCPSQACRPFSIDREGMLIGEGAAVLLLEEYEHAVRRGARVYAEISGYGATADAGHMTQPSVEGPARAMRLALNEAELRIEEIDYINAHGTGTKLNDVAETRAVRDVFGRHADKLAVSSTKSMHGHLMGASGAVELLITILGMNHGMLPPTANYRGRDPECDLDYVPNAARPAEIRAALSNSFAFGGLNAVLAVRNPLL